MTTPLPDLVLYGRPGCHLCDETHVVLDRLLEERRAAGRPAPRVVERNIDDDPGLRAAFASVIPVVELGAIRLELVTSPGRLRRLLATLDEPRDAYTGAESRADEAAGHGQRQRESRSATEHGARVDPEPLTRRPPTGERTGG